MTHVHECVCGVFFECNADILPAKDSRTRCQWWPDSICPACLSNIVEHATVEAIESMVETLGEYDPLTVSRVREFVGG